MANSNSNFESRYLTVEQLNALSNERLNKYCFIPGNKEDWDTDFNAEICDNFDKYDIMAALSGEPLGYIKTKIEITLMQWLPEGKKLNPKLIYTLQTILAKNPSLVRHAALTGTANSYLTKSCIKLTEVINKAFEYDLTVDDQ